MKFSGAVGCIRVSQEEMIIFETLQLLQLYRIVNM